MSATVSDPQMAGVSRARRLSEQLMASSQNVSNVRAGAPMSVAAPIAQALAAALAGYTADNRETALNTERRAEADKFNFNLMGGQPTGGASAPEAPMAAAPAPEPPAATPLAASLTAPTAAPPNIYGRNQDRVAQRDALLGADPVQLASASEANLPPGQPAFNPARPGANSELPGWDAGVSPPTGRVMPLAPAGAPSPSPPPATPLAASLGGAPAPTTPLASRLSVPTPERLMAAYAQASASPNPAIRAQAPQLLQMAQFGSLREDRTADNARQAGAETRQAEQFRQQFGETQSQNRETNRRADETLALARGTASRADQPTVGLNPIYGQDAQGNPVIMLSDNRGNVRQPALPDGVRPTVPTRDINLGTSFATLDRGGNVVASRPIDTAGRERDERIGAQQGTDIAGAPQALRTADTSLGQIQAVLDHPGMRTATGLTGALGAGSIPGTSAYDFSQRVEQLRGAAFLQAFSSMRGAGAITEAEGRKATDAIARLNRNQSPADFRASVEELRGIVSEARTRAAARAPAATAGMPGAQMPIAGTGQGASPPPASTTPTIFNPSTGQRMRLEGNAWVPVQ